MPQLFGRRSDARLRRVAIAAVLALLALGGLAAYVPRSDLAWNVGKPAQQPIPFRHDVHVRGLGLDCDSCHQSAERHGFAGMPSAHHCLTCHSHVLGATSMMEPLHTSLELGVEVPWRSVHRLPGYIRFHHGVHAQGGVACETCHGNVGQMNRTVKTETLSMAWCLDCHREHGGAHLTDCSTCHR